MLSARQSESNGVARIECIAEIRIEIPIERRAAMLEFYETLLGLPSFAAAGQVPGAWLMGRRGERLLLQYRHDPTPVDASRRLQIRAASLCDVEKRLLSRNWPFQRRNGLLWSSGGC